MLLINHKDNSNTLIILIIIIAILRIQIIMTVMVMMINNLKKPKTTVSLRTSANDGPQWIFYDNAPKTVSSSLNATQIVFTPPKLKTMVTKLTLFRSIVLLSGSNISGAMYGLVPGRL